MGMRDSKVRDSDGNEGRPRAARRWPPKRCRMIGVGAPIARPVVRDRGMFSPDAEDASSRVKSANPAVWSATVATTQTIGRRPRL